MLTGALIAEGLWRISLEPVDGWASAAEAAASGGMTGVLSRACSATPDSRSLVA